MWSSALLDFAATIQGKCSSLSMWASLAVIGFFFIVWLIFSQLLNKKCCYRILDWILAIALFLGTCIFLQLDCLIGNWEKVWMLAISMIVSTTIGYFAWRIFLKTIKNYAGYHPFVLGAIPFLLSCASIYDYNWILLGATLIVTFVFIGFIWFLKGAFEGN